MNRAGAPCVWEVDTYSVRKGPSMSVATAPATAGTRAAPGGGGRRLTSVDALRGLAVAGMLAVNNAGAAGGAYPQLGHADWHGFRLADLVFPLFLFVVGTSMALGPGRRLSLPRVLRRAVVLFGLGLALNAVPLFDWSQLRIMGVLQRIALAYLLAAVIVRLVPLWGQLAVGAALLLGHWALSVRVSVPGHGAGSLERAGSVAAWVDESVLGPAHGYFGTFPDPEGLLGTLTAAVTVLAGYWAGRALRDAPVRLRTALLLAAAGVAAAAVGTAWARALPLNKQLWTSSYTVYTAGLSLVVVAAAYLVVEVGHARWAAWPWAVLGRNAIVVYLGAELIRHVLRDTPVGDGSALDATNAWFAARAGGDVAGALAFIAVMIGGWWLVAAALHWRSWYVRI